MEPFSRESLSYQTRHLRQVERLSAMQIARNLNISKIHIEKVLKEDAPSPLLFRLHYKRLLKDIHSPQAILNTMKPGRVYPVLSQVKLKAGFVTSTQPDIFAVSHAKDFQSCFDSKVQPFFKDSASAIRRLQALSSDHALRNTLSTDYNANGFIKSHRLVSGKDDVGLLLSFVGGVSDSK
jgi:hypothetical protein